VVILDTNPITWGSKFLQSSSSSSAAAASSAYYDSKPATFSTLMDHFLVFLNAFLRIGDNFVAVIANHSTCSRFLYPSQKDSNSTQLAMTDITNVKASIMRELQNLVASTSDVTDTEHSESARFSGAFSQALCCK
jgi:hypothetical protein